MEKLKKKMEEALGEAELEAADEFYENLEAPKFVDLTAPDPRRSDDDLFWFCSRVGCDQKHEEELDSETIYKNFVLRVMAARSPNVRRRKGINGKAPSGNMKCPLSAPAKSSKPRVSKLALISSISRKLGDGRLKTRLSPKLTSTPKKVIPVASKFMTTPRNKGCIANKDNFLSVQNLKARSNLDPEGRVVVAKALVFQSPKKVLRKKNTIESESTPLRKICEGMANLEIESQKKRILGYSSKSTKDNRDKLKGPLHVDGSNRSERKVKVCEGSMMHSEKLKDRKGKSLGLTKEENKKGLKKLCGSMHHDQVKNFSTDADIEKKSGSDTLEVESGTSGNEANRDEEPLRTAESLANSSSADPSSEEVAPTSEFSETQLLDLSRDYINSQPKADDRGSEESDDLRIQVPEGREEEKVEGLHHAEIIKSSSAEKVSEDLATPKCRPSEQAIRDLHRVEVLDNDDKENASAPDSNRTMKLNTDASYSGKTVPHDRNQKVERTMNKNPKEAVAVAATGALGMKYRKPKPTNPKPFRLRTDERGILKETSLEKRRYPVVPVKETKTIWPGTLNSQRRQQENNITSKGGDSNESSETETCKTMRGMSVPKGRRKKILKEQLPNEAQKSELPSKRDNDSVVQRNTKPIVDQQQALRSNKVASTTRKVISCMKTGRLSLINETSSKLSRFREVGGMTDATKPLLKGRRPITIPKEPNFHSIHKPRSCTLNVA